MKLFMWKSFKGKNYVSKRKSLKAVLKQVVKSRMIIMWCVIVKEHLTIWDFFSFWCCWSEPYLVYKIDREKKIFMLIFWNSNTLHMTLTDSKGLHSFATLVKFCSKLDGTKTNFFLFFVSQKNTSVLYFLTLSKIRNLNVRRSIMLFMIIPF